MRSEQILQGKPLPTLFFLAFPAVLAGWIQTLFELVDAYWVSYLGNSSMSVLSAATFVMWHFYCIPMLLHPGLNQQISYALGEGKQKEARQLATKGILWSFFLGAFSAVLGYFTLPYLLDFMHIQGNLRPRVSLYLEIFFTSIPSFYAFLACLSIIRGYGQTKAVSFLSALVLILNGVFDPIFIYFFEFGVYGAIIASFLANVTGLFLALYYLVRSKFIAWESYGDLGKLAQIGYPLMVNNLMFCMVYLFLTRKIVSFGEAPLAAIGITARLEGIAYFCAVGIGSAATTAIGMSLGKGDRQRAIQYGNSAIFWALGFTLPWSLLLIFAPEMLIQIFTKDPEEIRHGTTLLRIMGYAEIALGVECVLEGVFAGTGKTFLAGSLALFFTLSRVPFVYFFLDVCEWGVEGIWWAISLSTLLKGISLALLWQKYRQNHGFKR